MEEQILLKYSVVIPTYNEAAGLRRLLGGISAIQEDGEVQIIVVVNGSSDQSAQVARDFRVQLIETPLASKSNALNLGDAAALHYPRVYLDADVSVSVKALTRLARSVENDAISRVAGLRPTVDTSKSSHQIQRYYALWSKSDFATAGHVGSGVYALSRAGRARFGEFPDVIADDRFIQQLFLPEERIAIDSELRIYAPHNVAAEVRRSTRVVAGNLQLMNRDGLHKGASSSRRLRALFRGLLHNPRLVASLPVFVYVKLLVASRARRLIEGNLAVPWLRDDSSRDEQRRSPR